MEDISNFSEQIEKIAEKEGIPYISALALYAKEGRIDEEYLTQFISEKLKAKIQYECEQYEMITPTSKLPF
jgi:hypothetical protein